MFFVFEAIKSATLSRSSGWKSLILERFARKNRLIRLTNKANSVILAVFCWLFFVFIADPSRSEDELWIFWAFCSDLSLFFGDYIIHFWILRWILKDFLYFLGFFLDFLLFLAYLDLYIGFYKNCRNWTKTNIYCKNCTLDFRSGDLCYDFWRFCIKI